MPCDYQKYPPNWKSEIRPAILERAKNCCEQCGLPNYMLISRWEALGLIKDLFNGPVYELGQDGRIKQSNYSRHLSDWGSTHMCKVVLTIAHLDHDTNNNVLENLKALCQKCHLNYDKHLHKRNARETNRKKKGLQNMFVESG